jgi:hypothetical protein
VIYWLFFAVGFTDEGMSALHDLISSGYQDFNDPVFWFTYIILPVNTITKEMERMLSSCVGITFRSPINRKAFQLWRYKMALSHIKTIVAFGQPDSLDPEHMNPTTQPYLHAMVSHKKHGRVQYETETSAGKNRNHYVDGMTRAFLLSFPEKFKEWADAVVLKYREPSGSEIPSVVTSDIPCDVHLDPKRVWKSYQSNGVFQKDANYDIPTNWDPHDLMCRMNKGDSQLAGFKTDTLEQILIENIPAAPTSKKRKNKNKDNNGPVSYFRFCTTTDSQQAYNFFSLRMHVTGKENEAGQ